MATLNILFLIICLVAAAWLVRKVFFPRKKPVDKGTIHIVIDQPNTGKKTKATEKQAIMLEAEAMFRTLQKKYLYSPVPYKVMGDFYRSKGLQDEALGKYQQMLRYLNADLDLNKLAEVLLYLRQLQAEEIVSEIEKYYQKDR
jgi:hypothetical protein